jgi:hypothetical protein
VNGEHAVLRRRPRLRREASWPDGHGGNFILKDPDQEGYATLAVAYARLRFEDHALTAGRISPQYSWNLDNIYRFYNRYDGAFIGRRDVRAMIPLVVPGRIGGRQSSRTTRFATTVATSTR